MIMMLLDHYVYDFNKWLAVLENLMKMQQYYPQTLLEEFKYVQEKTKIENLIHDDLEKSESDSGSNDETESDIDNDEYDE